ncbi:hypothetical protein NM688_g967 [Phlebia brevispora]|uniref:Uncharacterized protein n=1 Tax=Phlebia brevispora TaxID=194682 RepID=A0ACC1TD23_9APHY|nr:hypothetical protein NM688_g967 [Phlebia brevispora]
MDTHRNRRDDEDAVDDDELFAQLEADLENNDERTAAEREKGMQEMMRYMEQRKQMADTGHGRYDEIKDEFKVLDATIKEKFCVVHFFHNNFKRCKIMDQHLVRLSQKYFNTRFVRVFAENVPFLVEKLGIKVLPCVICFKKGVTCGRIVGFEELGGQDNFNTSALEAKLSQFGILKQEDDLIPPITYGSTPVVRERIRGQSTINADDDFDFDL